MQRAERPVVEPFPLPKQERSFGSLFSDLARDFSLLIRQEIGLAKAELIGGLTSLGAGAAMLAAGGLVAFAGFLVLLAAAVLGLMHVVAPWLAAVIVGVVTLIVGAALAWMGKSRLSAESLVPRRTIRSIKDDTEWAREQMR
jgi:hypothetical protein